MIPINRENVRDVLIAVLCIAAACGLFYLAGCGKPAGAENLPTPAEIPLPVKGGGVVPPGDSGNAHYPLPAKNIGADASPPQSGMPINQPLKQTIHGIDHPLTEPQPIYGGEAEPDGPITVIVIDSTGKLKREVVCGKRDSKGDIVELDHPCNTLPPLEGGTGTLNQTLPSEDLGTWTSQPIEVQQPPSKCLIYNGTKWVDCPDDPKMPTLSPPKCPNKLPALAVMIADPSFPDVWRGAYLCNAREIVPATSSTKWRYVDQKRYGYREWGRK